ncbi:NADH dehydrogenase I [Neisseria bacilliformis ATCC BAA-1200]|uniref:NADH dehydrogenase I n=1 Tax=Neisseria bacilliformis ATCC BAA-1200 TaxID=888742 RepID=F2BC09_9NEIS|nr:NADH dehydrogenase I [Neisseria bacilliformis ATCC BAA-1200]
MPSIAGIFNAADAVLGRKSRQNVDCQQTLIAVRRILHSLSVLKGWFTLFKSP